MSRNAFNAARDQAIAAEVNIDRSLLCPAHGCPNRWSVRGERGQACSAHYWAEPRDWPRITERLREDEFERARYAECRRADPSPEPTMEERRAVVDRLHRIFDNPDPKAWARRMHERHRNGARLTPAEVQAYRAALRLDAPGGNA